MRNLRNFTRDVQSQNDNEHPNERAPLKESVQEPDAQNNLERRVDDEEHEIARVGDIVEIGGDKVVDPADEVRVWGRGRRRRRRRRRRRHGGGGFCTWGGR